MICSKCKSKVKDNLSICPICGSPLKKKINKTIKNKYIKEDSSSQVGGTISHNSSFVNLKKKKIERQVKRSDYNSYLDYQEAKEALKDQNLAQATKSRSKLLTDDVQNGSSFFSILRIEKVDKRQPLNLKDYKSSLEENNNKQTGANKAKIKYAKNSAEASIKTKREKDYNEVGNAVKTRSYNSELKDKNKKENTIENNKINFFTNDNVINNNNNFEPRREEPMFFSPDSGKYFNQVGNNNQLNNLSYEAPNKVTKKKKFKIGDFLAYVAVMAIWVLAFVGIINYNKGNYYFASDNGEEEIANTNGVSKSSQVATSSGPGVTSIIYDNQYLKQISINSLDDVNKLIINDSVKQKINCPVEAKQYEEEIIENYGITAVNFCEIDGDLARELRDVVAYIYNEFPNARNYLTNITIANVSSTDSYIAAFMPVFTFATSNTNSGYPVGIKTQIILNAKYFLNPSKLKNSVSNGSMSGYFPPNANSSSTVAHEFGHYLSYVAMLNYYNTSKLNYVKSSDAKTLYSVYADFNEGDFSYRLLQEAYEEYQKNYLSIASFDDFRQSISEYAMAKNDKGKYIYDETIAEAFHDYYLNGDNAKAASKTIIEVLKSKL